MCKFPKPCSADACAAICNGCDFECYVCNRCEFCVHNANFCVRLVRNSKWDHRYALSMTLKCMHTTMTPPRSLIGRASTLVTARACCLAPNGFVQQARIASILLDACYKTKQTQLDDKPKAHKLFQFKVHTR